jgi:hypothetical protein
MDLQCLALRVKAVRSSLEDHRVLMDPNNRAGELERVPKVLVRQGTAQ